MKSKKGASGDFAPYAASRIQAAFVHQIANQGSHRRIVRPADECRRLTLLGDQAGLPKMPNMMRKSRSGDAHLCLESSARQSVVPGADQRPVNLQPDGAAKGFKLASSYFEFHRNIFKAGDEACQAVFRRRSKDRPKKSGRKIRVSVVQFHLWPSV
jgi:hypothetical protein